jgi:hypothetical protein
MQFKNILPTDKDIYTKLAYLEEDIYNILVSTQDSDFIRYVLDDFFYNELKGDIRLRHLLNLSVIIAHIMILNTPEAMVDIKDPRGYEKWIKNSYKQLIQ